MIALQPRVLETEHIQSALHFFITDKGGQKLLCAWCHFQFTENLPSLANAHLEILVQLLNGKFNVSISACSFINTIVCP